MLVWGGGGGGGGGGIRTVLKKANRQLWNGVMGVGYGDGGGGILHIAELYDLIYTSKDVR
jgi:hypothetical protein